MTPIRHHRICAMSVDQAGDRIAPAPSAFVADEIEMIELPAKVAEYK
jgi:hypothetical protein